MTEPASQEFNYPRLAKKRHTSKEEQANTIPVSNRFSILYNVDPEATFNKPSTHASQAKL